MQTLMGKTGRLIAAMLFVFPLAVAQKTIDAAPAKTPSSAIAGDWQGTLQAGMQQLHVVLHINQAADGSLSANMDSLDQGAKGIAIDQISFQNGKISFTSNVVHGSYEGKLTPDSAIEGTWTQGQSFPLTFKRAVTTSDADGYWLARWRRPQPSCVFSSASPTPLKACRPHSPALTRVEEQFRLAQSSATARTLRWR